MGLETRFLALLENTICHKYYEICTFKVAPELSSVLPIEKSFSLDFWESKRL